MKNILYLIVIATILTACGQGKESISEDERSSDEQTATKEVELSIAASTDDEAVQLIREFISEELDHQAYAGLHLAHEPSKHIVVLIQESHSLQEVGTNLENYSKQQSQSDGEYRVKLKSATYPYATLENMMNELNERHEEIIKTERKVLSFGINERDNRIDLYVSAREDLNEELLAEIIAGREGIVEVEAGVMNSLDENGLPTSEPYIVGNIKEIKEGENISFLIEDQIYVSVNSATVIKDSEGGEIDKEQLSIEDNVSVWVDGGVLDSLPASGYAVAIQLQ